MDIKQAVERIEIEMFEVKTFYLSLTDIHSKFDIFGKCSFTPSWKASELLVILELKASGNGDNVILDFSCEARYVDVEFDAFKSEKDPTLLNPLLLFIVSGLTFSTARGAILERSISSTNHPLLLPIKPPRDLIQNDGFSFTVFDGRILKENSDNKIS